MLEFNAIIEKYNQNGEKSGWHFVHITAEQALAMKPENKKAFRVKGVIDKVQIKGIALWALGHGAFILPLNAKLLKQLGKQKGDKLKLTIEHDPDLPPESKELMDCLADDPKALTFFQALSQANKNYFHAWIMSAKTLDTKTKRLVNTVEACAHSRTYPEMVRWLKGKS